MIHIYTFCDKTLIGKVENKSAKFLCENLYKKNFLINESCVYASNFNFDNLTFKNKDIYFLLLHKSNSKLNLKIANLLGEELTENNLLKNTLTEYFSRKNIPIDKNGEKEWLIPKSAVSITNPNGITQGYYVKIEESFVFVLPNNFNEFVSIYNDCLLNFLENKFPIESQSETYKTFGLSEEYITQIIKDQIKNKDKIKISIFSKGLENDIVIKANVNNDKFNSYRQIVFDKLEKFIYAVQPISMDEYLQTLLTTNNAKISIVGDFSVNNIINKLPSNTIKNNICCLYELPNTNSKQKFGIDLKQIQEFGEESAEVAYSLAVKTLEISNSDIVLSCLSNIQNNKCIAYIALGNKIKVDIYKNQFFGSLNEISENISQTAKFYLIKMLKSKEYQTT